MFVPTNVILPNELTVEHEVALLTALYGKQDEIDENEPKEGKQLNFD